MADVKPTQEQILDNIKTLARAAELLDEQISQLKELKTDTSNRLNSLQVSTESQGRSIDAVVERLKALESINRQVSRLEGLITNTSNRVDGLQTSTDSQGKIIENMLERINAILPHVQGEVDRMSSYNQDLHSLFRERFEGIKQDLDGLRERDIRSLATKTDISEIASKLEALPKLEHLTDQNSPLATKNQLMEIQKELSYTKGLATAQIVGVVGTIVLLIGMWINFSSTLSKIPQVASPSPQPSEQPKASP